MIITITSFKGGVGKTTSAIHLAGYLQDYGDTLLVDGDLNRSATSWAGSGSLPFQVCDEKNAKNEVANRAYVVIDTAARPTAREIRSLARGSDYLVIPTTPDRLSMEALVKTIDVLESLEASYKILLTRIPPPPRTDAAQARDFLTKQLNLPVFRSQIREYAAFEKAALHGTLVGDARDERGRKDPRGAFGAEDYALVAKEILRDGKQIQLPREERRGTAANC